MDRTDHYTEREYAQEAGFQLMWRVDERLQLMWRNREKLPEVLPLLPHLALFILYNAIQSAKKDRERAQKWETTRTSGDG